MSRPFGALFKEHAVLIAGIALPVLLVLLFAIARVVPEKVVPDPLHRAIFMIQPWNGGYSYSTDVTTDGKLKVTYNTPKDTNYPPESNLPPAKIYIFNANTDTLEEIALETPAVPKGKTKADVTIPKFESITVTKDTKAPDGYAFQAENYNGSSLITEIFSYRNSHTPNSISKDGRLIPLKTPSGLYGNFSFIGWVVKE